MGGRKVSTLIWDMSMGILPITPLKTTQEPVIVIPGSFLELCVGNPPAECRGLLFSKQACV